MPHALLASNLNEQTAVFSVGWWLTLVLWVTELQILMIEIFHEKKIKAGKLSNCQLFSFKRV